MIRGLFLSVVNQGIAAGYLIAAVIVARFLLKKAPKSVCCLLWLLVGIRLVMPFSVVSVFSLIPSGYGVSGNIAEIAGQGMTERNGSPNISDTTPSFDMGNINEEMIWASGMDNASEESVNKPYVYFSIASVIWLAGIGAMLLYFVISWLRLANRVRFAIPAKREGIKYYQCEKIDSPFLFGFFKTRIYVPSGLNVEDLGYVLKHEAVHRQRRDYLIKPIGYVLLAVYWFNPFVWAAYILLCRDIELACDERVIKELGEERKKEYALALLSCSVNHRIIAACPVAFGETGVKGRVKNVLRYKKPTFWVIAATVTVVAVVAVCFMTERVETDAAENSSGSKQFVMVNEAGSMNAKTQTAQNAVRNLGGIENIPLIDTNEAVFPSENVIGDTGMHSAVTEHDYYDESDCADYLEQWAEAFCSRDGKTIAALSDVSIRSELSDSLALSWGMDDNHVRYTTFGWSSPWPWDGDEKNYRILSASDGEAVILYYAWVSDPHVWTWREELSYTIQDGKFKVTAENTEFFTAICVAEEFYNAYPDGVINGTMMDYYAYNQAGEVLNKNAKNPDMAAGAYTGLDAPDTAAIKLLNILQNENKIATDVEYLNEEQTEAVVTFTFLENASTAKIRMIKPYGADSIWLPQTCE